MAPGPDQLKIHVYLPCPPPRRTGRSLGALIFLLFCWPLVPTGWAIWFLVTLLMTFAGLVLVAAVALGSSVGLRLRVPRRRGPGLSRVDGLGDPGHHDAIG